ncbi:MAG: RNA-guided endonuclease InsQ/TnpB family protein [Nitrososphaeria archaeon]
MSESLLVKSYSIPHTLDLSEFINDYMRLLNDVLNNLWEAIEWKRRGKRLVPFIKKDKTFRKGIRDKHILKWIYSKHYVDSAIKQAYSMLNSWRKRYLKGRANKEKPLLKRKFVRVKETLYSYRDGKIRISKRANEEYIEFNLTKAWFWERINQLDIGELILKENQLIITVRKKQTPRIERPVAWDTNLFSLDGYDGENDVQVDLRKLHTIHRVYELKRKRIQELPEKSKKKLFHKYRCKEKNRVNDLLHKMSKRLASRTNIFEDLSNFKERVARTKSKRMNRQNSKHNYIMLQKYTEYKSAWNGYSTIYVKPYNTSKTCSRCGFVNKDLKGAEIFECPNCGFTIDRQKNAARNIWNQFLRMWGQGFAPKGAKPNEKLPMNPEGDEGDEAQGLSVGSIRINT